MATRLETVILLLLWAVIIWRICMSQQGRREWALTIALAALGCGLALRQPTVISLADENLGSDSLVTLLKHLLAVVSVAAALEVAMATVNHGTGQRSRRIRYGLLAITSTAIIILCACLSRGRGDRSMGGHTEDPLVFLYWSVWLGYLGAALLLITWRCLRHIRQASTSLLRFQLVAISAGAHFALAYVANKAAFTVLGFFPGTRPPFSAATTIRMNNVLLGTMLVLTLIGATLPTSVSWRNHRALKDLDPLWRALTEANPSVVLGYADGGTTLRLYRHVVEINDAILAMQDYLQPCPCVERAARAVAQRARKSPRAAEAFVEAAQIKVALRAQVQGRAQKRGTPPRVTHTPANIVDYAEEIRRLRLIARAYRSGELQQLVDSLK